MSDDKKKTIQQRVDDKTTRTFWITNCPESVWKDFKDYAEKEANNNYSIALKILMNTSKANVKERLIYERYIQVESRLREVEKNVNMIMDLVSKGKDKEIEDEIEEDVSTKEEPKNVVVPTMGSGDNVKYKDKTPGD